ncbi:hypothetical protein [Peribacillus glennii]|nr:hypothetical protein [Peribacillus glennii]
MAAKKNYIPGDSRVSTALYNTYKKEESFTLESKALLITSI